MGLERQPQTVTFRTPDGVDLEADLLPGNSTWVLLAHMRPADRTSWSEFAPMLNEAGYTVLAYDNRGYGGSEGTREPFELEIDATSAIAYAYENDARRLVFVGASMNGATASVLSGFYDLAAVIVLSGVRIFGKVSNVEASLGDSTMGIMFVAAEDDGLAVADAERLSDAAPGGYLRVLETGGHGTNMLRANPDLAPFLLEWLEGQLDR